VEKEELRLDVTPLVADQELDVSFRYWEGAVAVSGSKRGESVGGFGYVELTGYARNPRNSRAPGQTPAVPR